MAKRILLVDKDASVIKALTFALEQDGYEVEAALNAEEALNNMEEQKYDLLIMETVLPKTSGLELCQTIREQSDIPIMFLSSKGDDMDKILGFEYGADDYVVKPYNLLEFKARIKAIMRRIAAKEPEYKQHIEINGVELNTGNRSVSVNGVVLNLTVKEFDLLYIFMSSPCRVFTRQELLAAVWGPEYMGDLRTVDVHIRRLREKMEVDASKPIYIMTKWGVGYFFAQ